jgi:hypothetical protein
VNAAEAHAEKMARLRAEIAATKAETARLRTARKAIERAIAKAGR